MSHILAQTKSKGLTDLVELKEENSNRWALAIRHAGHTKEVSLGTKDIFLMQNFGYYEW